MTASSGKRIETCVAVAAARLVREVRSGRRALICRGVAVLLALYASANPSMASETDGSFTPMDGADLKFAYGESITLKPGKQGPRREGSTKELAHACAQAAGGNADAQYALGAMFFFGRGGATYQPDKAVAWFEKAAARGHWRAGNFLRLLRDRGVSETLDSGCPLRHARKQPGRSARPKEVVEIANRIASTAGLDPELVLAIIAIESSFRADAISPKGAQGLMQLMPGTADRFGVTDPFDPAQNILGGVSYLKWLLKHFDGELPLALAAYNAGENAVERYGGIPPYPETMRYVAKVQELYSLTKQTSTQAGAPKGVVLEATATLFKPWNSSN